MSDYWGHRGRKGDYLVDVEPLIYAARVEQMFAGQHLYIFSSLKLHSADNTLLLLTAMDLLTLGRFFVCIWVASLSSLFTHNVAQIYLPWAQFLVGPQCKPYSYQMTLEPPPCFPLLLSPTLAFRWLHRSPSLIRRLECIKTGNELLGQKVKLFIPVSHSLWSRRRHLSWHPHSALMQHIWPAGVLVWLQMWRPGWQSPQPHPIPEAPVRGDSTDWELTTEFVFKKYNYAAKCSTWKCSTSSQERLAHC